MTLSLETLRRDGARRSIRRSVARVTTSRTRGSRRPPSCKRSTRSFASVLGDDALAMARETFQRRARGAAKSSGRPRLLLEWQAECACSRELAPLDEREIAWEAAAIVRVADGGGSSISSASIEIANSTDRDERHAIERRARRRSSATSSRRCGGSASSARRTSSRQLEIAPSYNATFDAAERHDRCASLRDECEAFLRDTQAMWDDVFAEFAQARPRHRSRAKPRAPMRSR